MASKKIRNLVVKVGSYMKDGEEKPRWKNVGSLMKTDDGGTFLLLDKTFNPAGVPGDADRDSVLISMFEIDDQKQRPAQGEAKQAAPVQSKPADNDDIPF